MKTMYLLRGVSGSGKSTLAKNLAAMSGGWHFENDTYHMDDSGVYRYDIANKEKAQDLCFSAAAEKILKGDGKDVIVANCNTDHDAIDKYLELAKTFGYTVVSLVVENRHGNNSVHDVPERIRDRQAQEIAETLKLK